MSIGSLDSRRKLIKDSFLFRPPGSQDLPSGTALVSQGAVERIDLDRGFMFSSIAFQRMRSQQPQADDEILSLRVDTLALRERFV